MTFLQRFHRIHGNFAAFAAVAPGIDQLAVSINTDDFAVIRAPSTVHLAGDEIHVLHRKVKGSPLFITTGENCCTNRTHEMTIFIDDDGTTQLLFEGLHNTDVF